MRQEQAPPVVAKVKLTLYAGERFFGPGICELLERIRESGSIQAAAAQMNMSYTKAWRILNRAEGEMGVCLITRVSGGRRGGSSTLTAAGEEAVAAFREMEAKLAGLAGDLLAARRDAFRPQAPADGPDGEACGARAAGETR